MCGSIARKLCVEMGGGCESNHSGAEDPLQRPRNTKRLTLAPMPAATLNASDAQRLQSVLDGIADESSAGRWASLDQLRYFCEGADTPLLEAIGGKRFSTQAVLLQLLKLANGLGGPVPARTAATSGSASPSATSCTSSSAYYATPPPTSSHFSSPQTVCGA